MNGDLMLSRRARWLRVVSAEEPGCSELLWTSLNDTAKALQDRRRAKGTLALSFTVDGRRRRHRKVRDRGVVFLSEPPAMGSGGIDAVFEDGCGNLLNLHQDATAASDG